MRNLKVKLTFFALLCSFIFPLTVSAETAWEVLETIPIQQGGRVKPLQSFATEAVRQVTGKVSYEGQSATQTIFKWIAEPEKWNTTAMVPVEYRPLRKEFGVMLVDHKASPEILLENEAFMTKVQSASTKKQQKEPLLRLEQERLDLYEKAALFRDIATGNNPGWIANPEDPRTSWFSFLQFGTEDGVQGVTRFYSRESLHDVNQTLRDLVLATEKNTESGPSVQQAIAFKDALTELFDSKNIILDEGLLSAELRYNRWKPFSWAWKLYLAGALFLLLFSLFELKNPTILAGKKQIVLFSLIAAGFVIHSYGFYLRCLISGRPPVSNMYESVIWVSWAVVFFAASIYIFYRARSIVITAAFVSAIALMIAESFPVVLNPAISPLVPVLRSTLWLTVHVLTITLSYGAFALAWGLGHVVVFGYAFKPEKRELHKNLAQYLYRAIQIGVILLAAGTVLGGVWANYSWGRFWGWDPKETWALIALLGYIGVLHGRLTGWIRTFGFAVGCVASFLLVVMAWYGVNYVLAAGLHSYGFGGGGAPYVLTVCLLDMALIGWGAWKYKHDQAKKPASVG